MSLPVDLLLVRHALSTDNEERASGFSNDNGSRKGPDSRVPLAAGAQAQMRKTGAWIKKNFGSRFDIYWFSPYERTKVSAGLLDLPDAQWTEKYELRERNMGDLRNVSRCDSRFSDRTEDPFHWIPEGGESVAEVCENRVRVCFEELADSEVGSAILVTSGIVMSCFRMRFQHWSVDQYNYQYNNDRAGKSWIHNASLIWYSRRNPKTREVIPGKFKWIFQACPWDMRLSSNKWETIPDARKLTNEELLQSL